MRDKNISGIIGVFVGGILVFLYGLIFNQQSEIDNGFGNPPTMGQIPPLGTGSFQNFPSDIPLNGTGSLERGTGSQIGE